MTRSLSLKLLPYCCVFARVRSVLRYASCCVTGFGAGVVPQVFWFFKAIHCWKVSCGLTSALVFPQVPSIVFGSRSIAVRYETRDGFRVCASSRRNVIEGDVFALRFSFSGLSSLTWYAIHKNTTVPAVFFSTVVFTLQGCPVAFAFRSLGLTTNFWVLSVGCSVLFSPSSAARSMTIASESCRWDQRYVATYRSEIIWVPWFVFSSCWSFLHTFFLGSRLSPPSFWFIRPVFPQVIATFFHTLIGWIAFIGQMTYLALKFIGDAAASVFIFMKRDSDGLTWFTLRIWGSGSSSTPRIWLFSISRFFKVPSFGPRSCSWDCRV